jgi:uncharacterized protein YukE
VGEGTRKGELHSGIERSTTDLFSHTEDQHIRVERQNEPVKNQLFNLLSQFNSQLQVYVQGCLDILSMPLAESIQEKGNFDDYDEIIEKVEGEVLPVFSTWMNKTSDDRSVFEELEKIYDCLKNLYKNINSSSQEIHHRIEVEQEALKNYSQAVETNASVVKDEAREQLKQDLATVKEYIARRQTEQQNSLAELENKFKSYKSYLDEQRQAGLDKNYQVPANRQVKAPGRHRVAVKRPLSKRIEKDRTEFDKRRAALKQQGEKIADERFDNLILAFQGESGTSSFSSQFIEKNTRNDMQRHMSRLLWQIECLSKELAEIAAEIAEAEIAGFEFLKTQTAFQEEYNKLKHYTQYLGNAVSGHSMMTLNVPHLMDCFSKFNAALYEETEIGIMLWKEHFELNKETLPAVLDTLQKRIEVIKARWEKVWWKQAKDSIELPLWDFQELLLHIKDGLFDQQRLIACQKEVISYIKEKGIRLHDGLLEVLNQFNQDNVKLNRLTDVSSSASDTSSPLSPTFFGGSRRSSHTSVSSDADHQKVFNGLKL